VPGAWRGARTPFSGRHGGPATTGSLGLPRPRAPASWPAEMAMRAGRSGQVRSGQAEAGGLARARGRLTTKGGGQLARAHGRVGGAQSASESGPPPERLSDTGTFARTIGARSRSVGLCRRRAVGGARGRRGRRAGGGPRAQRYRDQGAGAGGRGPAGGRERARRGDEGGKGRGGRQARRWRAVGGGRRPVGWPSWRGGRRRAGGRELGVDGLGGRPQEGRRRARAQR